MTTQIGLSACDFLLLAEGHLVKAHEALDHTEVLDPTQGAITLYMVGEAICRADGNVRHALGLLKQQKEETCNKP